ncbi:MAG: NHLP leader peptide family RiPP precursor [Lactobacillales bacterium]|nr:NHLP leader peptide family RiPP precursor [Lactobacillales bacterium]
MAWSEEKINEIYARVMQKATIDEEFRQDLMKDVNATIEKLIGEKLPEGVNLKIIENDPNYNATFVLPNLSTGEMDLDALDDVAGGVSGLLVISACAVAIGDGGGGVCGADVGAGK